MAVIEGERRRTRISQLDREEEQHRELIDFKMVTFSLGGKDYGIDIMKVKEIAKYSQFTYVPNAPHFVQGVYNLRGDIISIIDLRKMFNLPVGEEDGVRNGLILRLDNRLLGIIVDKIDKVVGISSSSIQPPHPIFGDINIKFISGVVEHEKRLYIILDVERIFRKEEEKEESSNVNERRDTEDVPAVQKGPDLNASTEQLDRSFINETLQTFANFHVTDVNRKWVERRFDDWRSIRKGVSKPVQLEGPEDAQEFLQPFYSPYNSMLWSEAYCKQVEQYLPETLGKNIVVWNPGCGRGLETYSLACILKARYPESLIKIWAVDKDLMAISAAPTISFSPGDVPEHFKPFMVEGTKGLGFSSDIKDSILFEYSDITNGSTVPDCDFILARDLVSFLNQAQQQALIAEFSEKLRPQGLLFLGKNEYPDSNDWECFGKDAVSVARKL